MIVDWLLKSDLNSSNKKAILFQQEISLKQNNFSLSFKLLNPSLLYVPGLICAAMAFCCAASTDDVRMSPRQRLIICGRPRPRISPGGVGAGTSLGSSGCGCDCFRPDMAAWYTALPGDMVGRLRDTRGIFAGGSKSSGGSCTEEMLVLLYLNLLFTANHS